MAAGSGSWVAVGGRLVGVKGSSSAERGVGEGSGVGSGVGSNVALGVGA